MGARHSQGAGETAGRSSLTCGLQLRDRRRVLERRLGELPILKELVALALQGGGAHRGRGHGRGASGPGDAPVAGPSAPRPPPGCPLAPPAGARARAVGPSLSAPAPGAWPAAARALSGRLPPSLLRVSFFWMLPMARGSAALLAPVPAPPPLWGVDAGSDCLHHREQLPPRPRQCRRGAGSRAKPGGAGPPPRREPGSSGARWGPVRPEGWSTGGRAPVNQRVSGAEDSSKART